MQATKQQITFADNERILLQTFLREGAQATRACVLLTADRGDTGTHGC